jgi:hypothetical protein
MFAWAKDAIRIEVEKLGASSHVNYSAYTATVDFLQYLGGELAGGQQDDATTADPLVTDRRIYSCRRALRLDSNVRFETKFSGRSGNYDVITVVLFSLEKDREFDGELAIGSFRHTFVRHMRNFDTERFVVTRNLSLTTGDPIVLEAGNNPSGWMEIDFIEFIPVESAADRPIGNGLTWRFFEFYKMLDYDEMNIHFFIYRFPVGYFLTVLFSYLLFGRTPGNMIMGCYVVNSNGQSIHFGQCLIRSLVLLFHPLWAPFYLRQDRMLSDIISGSRVVVPRRQS